MLKEWEDLPNILKFFFFFMQNKAEGRRKLFVGLVKWEEVSFNWILTCPVVMAPEYQPYT